MLYRFSNAAKETAIPSTINIAAIPPSNMPTPTFSNPGWTIANKTMIIPILAAAYLAYNGTLAYLAMVISHGSFFSIHNLPEYSPVLLFSPPLRLFLMLRL